MISADTHIVHAGQLVTISIDPADSAPRRGRDLASLNIIDDGAIAAKDGRIVWVGPTSDLPKAVSAVNDDRVIDAKGRVVTPGLIDPHSHPVFAEPRAHEFELRALGKSYQEIAAAGGGIKNSVEAVRSADLESLVRMGRHTADRMLAHGTTTAEAKSGYGLSLEAEMKLLEAIRRVNESHPIDWVPTLLAAHEFPPEFEGARDEYVRLITDEILPIIAEHKLAEFNDVFFESGVFDRMQTESIQRRAAELGFGLKFHVDQLTDVGGAELAVSMKANSADHLEFVSESGVRALAGSDTIAVMLPGATYFLDLQKRPPVRDMIERGVIIALATDCNPGSNMSESVPLAMNQACVMYKMTPAETLVAATLNAAHAVRRAHQIGTLAIGKQCDIVIWDVSDFREIAYHYGVNLVHTVVKNGKALVRNGEWA
ncbi:MAG: imidazolonepropionase [Candidatus Zixiibacteriota bacterium]